MKRTLTAIISLFLAIVICFLGTYKLNKSCEQMKNELNNLIKISTTSNNDKIKKATAETVTQWENTSKILNVLLIHSETDELSIKIKSLSIYASNGDKEMLFNSAYEAIYQIDDICENQKISLQNIF